MPSKSPKINGNEKTIDIPESTITVNKKPDPIEESDDDSYITMNMEAPDSERELV